MVVCWKRSSSRSCHLCHSAAPSCMQPVRNTPTTITILPESLSCHRPQGLVCRRRRSWQALPLRRALLVTPQKQPHKPTFPAQPNRPNTLLEGAACCSLPPHVKFSTTRAGATQCWLHLRSMPPLLGLWIAMQGHTQTHTHMHPLTMNNETHKMN